MARRLTGLNPLSYIGVDPVNPTQAVIYQRNPTVNDYDNFTLQCQWLNESTQQLWVLVNKELQVATWKEIGGGGGSGIQTMTGDAGGAVGPDGSNNIDIEGGGPYVFTGNPGAHSLTLTDNGTIAYTYTADSGTATPSSNNLNIVGGGVISTSGSGDTLTISAAGSVAVQIDADSGTATPSMGVLNVLGGDNITTSASGNTVTAAVSGTTEDAVQVGNAAGSLTSLPLGTDGQIIIGATGATPLFADLTSTDMSVTITTGPNTLDLSVAGAGPGVTTIHTDSGNAAPAAGILNVNGDGSHIQTTGSGNTVTAEIYGFTDNAPVVGNASGSLDSLSPMTTGQLMIGVTGSVPNLARLLAGTNIAIDDTSSPGNITISSSGGGGGGIIKTTFTSNGTWTKNPEAEYVYLQIWSGGGGGASGSSGGYTSGPVNIFTSGTGGAARGASFYLLPASAFDTTESVVIGLGGSGGAALTSGGVTLYGNSGSDSGYSSVGSLIGGRGDYAYLTNFNTYPPAYTTVTYTNGGKCATNVSGTGTPPEPGWVYLNTAPNTALQFKNINNQGNTQSFVDNGGGSSGGSAALTDVLPYLLGLGGRSYASPTPVGAPTSGGAGGSLQQLISSGVYTSGPGGTGGGIWNNDNTYIATGGTGATAGSGNPGGDGPDASSLVSLGVLSGGLGGGGGSTVGGGVNGADGGDGGFPGGAGGGGSACSLGFTSGAGGDGADGYVVIYEFLSGSGSTTFTWVVVTGDTAMTNNIGYIANSGSLITLTLPTTATIGDIIRVTGKGSGGWTIAQNSGQSITYGSITTTTGVGGSLSSNDPSDSVELVCVTADTEWLVLSSVGTLIYV